MTKGECMALLAIAGRCYGQAIDEKLADDWAAALGDVPAELGIKAMRAHTKASKYFPTIADIRSAADAAKPAVLYLPPHVPDPVPREEIRAAVEATLKKLRGGP